MDLWTLNKYKETQTQQTPKTPNKNQQNIIADNTPTSTEHHTKQHPKHHFTKKQISKFCEPQTSKPYSF